MRIPVHNLIKNNTRYRGAYAESLKEAEAIYGLHCRQGF